MGPTWLLSAPGGPHGGPMNFVIRGLALSSYSTIGVWGNICGVFMLRNSMIRYITRWPLPERLSSCYLTHVKSLKSIWFEESVPVIDIYGSLIFNRYHGGGFALFCTKSLASEILDDTYITQIYTYQGLDTCSMLIRLSLKQSRILSTVYNAVSLIVVNVYHHRWTGSGWDNCLDIN